MKIRLKRYTFNLRGKYLALLGAILALIVALMFVPWGWAVVLAGLLITGVAYWAMRLRVPRDTPLPHLRVKQARIEMALPEGDEFRFAVLGDMPAKGEARKAVLRNAQQFAPLFLCQTGDVVKYANPRTWSGYMRFLERHLAPGLPVYHSPGNHDIDHNLLRRYYQFYEHYLGLTNYVVDVGAHWRLILFDTARRRLSNEQKRFLLRALDEARDANRRAILLTHMPPRHEPAGVKHSLDEKTTRALRRLVQDRDVAALFCGHIHDLIQCKWEGVPVYIGGLSKDAFQSKPKAPGEIIPAGYYQAYVMGWELRVKPVSLLPHQKKISNSAPKTPLLLVV